MNVYKTRTLTGQCVKDSSQRLLPHFKDFGPSNSVKMCSEYCTTRRFEYMGVQYGSQCFCGNIVPDTRHFVSNAECNMACTGEKQKMCGGTWRMNVHKIGKFGTLKWQGLWGYFPRFVSFCPTGSYVFGYRLKSEHSQGSDGDDTALNAIELICKKPASSSITGRITSNKERWGSWGSEGWCPGNNNPVIGFEVMEEASQGKGDDTAVNHVHLSCATTGKAYASTNTLWGNWKPSMLCPSGSAVVGLRTQVEISCGGDCDDTALNGLEVHCHHYPF